jgi:FdhD protein
MSNSYEPITQWQFKLHTNQWEEDCQNIITEKSVALHVNGEHWLNFICSPSDLEALAIGFLYNEDIITTIDQVKTLTMINDANTINVDLLCVPSRPAQIHRTSIGIAFNSPLTPTSGQHHFRTTAKALIDLYAQFNANQTLHNSMGGFHSAALSDGKQINISVEDVGRHNALDKISGHFLLRSKPFIPQVILLSGRISTEMIHKAIHCGVSIIVSRTTPTFNAIKTAQNYQITLIGYMRKDHFTVYSHPERIVRE